MGKVWHTRVFVEKVRGSVPKRRPSRYLMQPGMHTRETVARILYEKGLRRLLHGCLAKGARGVLQSS